MKKIIIYILLILPIFSIAQVSKITLQANGLTCSMCSNAINKSLLSLPFIKKTEPNIKNSSFDIYLNNDSTYNFDDIKNQVEDAGFSVASLYVYLKLPVTTIQKDEHLVINGHQLHFINGNNTAIKGDQKLKIVDKGFVSAKEFKLNNKYTNLACYQTGKKSICCTNKNDLSTNERVFHVLL